MTQLYRHILFSATLLISCVAWTQPCLSGWDYRVEMSVDNQNSDTLFDHQIEMTFNSQSLILAGKMQSNCEDVRVYSFSGDLLQHWVDPNTINTPTTSLWVQVDTLPANEIANIYLFYGNGSVSSSSDAELTFELFDDFIGSALDASKWNQCGNASVAAGSVTLNATPGGTNGVLSSVLTFNDVVVAEMMVNSVSEGTVGFGQVDAGGDGWLMGYEEISSTELMRLMESNGNAICDTLVNQTPVINQVGSGATSGVWTFKWFANNEVSFQWPGGLETRVDGAESGTFGAALSVRLGCFHNLSSVAGSANIDWCRVRKYALLEPITTLGTEVTTTDNVIVSNDGPFCEGTAINLEVSQIANALYAWVGPGGFSDNVYNPTIATSSAFNSGTYYVTVTVAGGCGAIFDSTIVEVSPQTVGGSMNGSDAVCDISNSGYAHLTGFTGDIEYWETSNNALGPWLTMTNNNDSIFYNDLQENAYYRAVLSSGVCPNDTSSLAFIEVNEATVPGYILGNDEVCEGDNDGQLLLNNNVGSVTNWESSTDNGVSWNVITNNTEEQLYNNLSTTTLYRALVQDGVCPSAYSDTVEITVNPKPVPSFNSSAVCQDELTSFQNTSTVASGYIFENFWDFGDGNGDVVPNPVHTFLNPGIQSVLLMTISNKGCIDSVRNNVQVYPKPTVNFTQVDVCDGNPMVFTNLSSGVLNSYEWNFGDGTGDYYPQDTSYTFASDGEYEVTLVATTNQGCVDSLIEEVEVFAIASLDFTGDSVCLGFPITFANNSQTTSSSIQYNWSFGDGQFSNNLSPIHTYLAAGVYTVTLQSTVAGGCVNAVSQNVEIYPEPTASFTYLNACLYDSVRFVNTSSIANGSVMYEWNFGDGETSNSYQENHLYSVPNSYNVSLSLTSDFGCTQTTSELIDVYPLPNANFSYADVCDTDPMSFANSSTISSGSMIYQWNFGDGTTSTNIDPSNTYSSYGVYTVGLIAESNFGCKDTIERTVEVFPLPDVSFGFTVACDGFPTTFTNNSSIVQGNIIGYNWDFGDASSSTASDPTHQYLNSGLFAVELEATSDEGCMNSATNDITVSTFPVANFDIDNVCNGSPIQPVNTSTITVGVLTYTWEFGDGGSDNVENPSHTYAGIGTYPVELTVESDLGCIDSVTKFVIVYDAPIVDAGPDSTISQGFSLDLEGSAIGASSYSWSPDLNLSNNTIADPTATPLDSTTYYLTVTDLNGCVSTDSVNIHVLEDYKLFIHNLVTPDGNGQNDTWVITNIETFETANIAIYDRWGTEIFQVIGYQNDWNGVSEFDELPDGTYYYTVQFNDNDRVYSGAVSVLRNR